MRNLVSRSVRRSRLGAEGILRILHFCTNPETNDVFYATEDSDIGCSDGSWQVTPFTEAGGLLGTIRKPIP